MFRLPSVLLLYTAFCSIGFPRLQAESYQLRFTGSSIIWTTAIPVDDGKTFIALVPEEVDPEQGVTLVYDGTVQKAKISADPISRLIVARAESLKATAMPLLKSSSISDGYRVEARDGLLRGRVTGRQQRISGKILPLALLKALYTETAPPIYGEAVMDSSGHLLGLTYQLKGCSDTFILPVEVIHRALEEIREHGQIRRAWIGLMLSPDRIEPCVTQVMSDSPAAKAGLREGDLLLQVGTHSTSSYEEAVDAFYYLRPEHTESWKIMRNGNPMTITLTPLNRSQR